MQVRISISGFGAEKKKTGTEKLTCQGQFQGPSPPTCQEPSWAVFGSLFYRTGVVVAIPLGSHTEREAEKLPKCKSKINPEHKAEQSESKTQRCLPIAGETAFRLSFSILFPPNVHKYLTLKDQICIPRDLRSLCPWCANARNNLFWLGNIFMMHHKTGKYRTMYSVICASEPPVAKRET